MKRTIKRAYGIDGSGRKILVCADMVDAARRAGQTLELFTQDLIDRDGPFLRQLIIEDIFE